MVKNAQFKGGSMEGVKSFDLEKGSVMCVVEELLGDGTDISGMLETLLVERLAHMNQQQIELVYEYYHREYQDFPLGYALLITMHEEGRLCAERFMQGVKQVGTQWGPLELAVILSRLEKELAELA